MSGDLFHSNGSSRNSSAREYGQLAHKIASDRDLQPFCIGKESSGYVVTLKEEFGFVRCASSSVEQCI